MDADSTPHDYSTPPLEVCDTARSIWPGHLGATEERPTDAAHPAVPLTDATPAPATSDPSTVDDDTAFEN